MRLVVLDYLVSAAVVAALAMLSLSGLLDAPVLLVLAVLKAITSPLSHTGLRTVLPVIVPRRLWDVANAVDSAGYVMPDLIGPAVAGLLMAAFNGETALLFIAGCFLVSAVAAAGLDVPDPEAVSGSVTRAAIEGVQYVARNATLRALAVCISLWNVGWGIIVVAIPVILLTKFGVSIAAVGWFIGLLGVGALPSALFFGRFGTAGREPMLIAASGFAAIPAYLAVGLAPSVWIIGAALLIIGAANGPLDVGLFGLRQRRTDPAWFGRALAVSASLNFSGLPIGSALGGALAGRNPQLAMLVGAAVTAVSAVLTLVLIPRQEPSSDPL